MSFLKKVQKILSIHSIEQDLEEIEDYLNVANHQLDKSINKLNTPKIKIKSKKYRVDSQWISQTARKKIKLSLKKISKHM